MSNELKKKWRPKIQSDVENIVNTDRGYKLIYFITNQFVRDKVRAAVEDELKDKHAVDVRILDRSWITECVYEHGRLEIAVESLSLTGYGQQQLMENDAVLGFVREQAGRAQYVLSVCTGALRRATR